MEDTRVACRTPLRPSILRYTAPPAPQVGVCTTMSPALVFSGLADPIVVRPRERDPTAGSPPMSSDFYFPRLRDTLKIVVRVAVAFAVATPTVNRYCPLSSAVTGMPRCQSADRFGPNLPAAICSVVV